MDYQTIIMEKKEGVATITLNRPHRRNALDPVMSEELPDAFKNVAADDEVRAVIITGAGQAFCAGADVKDRFLTLIEEIKRGEFMGVITHNWGEKACLLLKSIEKPLIAAINGPAVGFGCTLALACDIRIASEDARMIMGFVRVGLTPEFGSTYFLPRLIGIAKACELIFTGRPVAAQEAKEIGLVNQVVPASELNTTAYELARTIAQGPPLAIRWAKLALYQGLDADLPTQLRLEDFIINACRFTRDHVEGASAFVEKREPRFQGK